MPFTRTPIERLQDRLGEAAPEDREDALYQGVRVWIETSLDITLNKAERAAWTEARLRPSEARPLILTAMRDAALALIEREGLR